MAVIHKKVSVSQQGIVSQVELSRNNFNDNKLDTTKINNGLAALTDETVQVVDYNDDISSASLLKLAIDLVENDTMINEEKNAINDILSEGAVKNGNHCFEYSIQTNADKTLQLTINNGKFNTRYITIDNALVNKVVNFKTSENYVNLPVVTTAGYYRRDVIYLVVADFINDTKSVPYLMYKNGTETSDRSPQNNFNAMINSELSMVAYPLYDVELVNKAGVTSVNSVTQIFSYCGLRSVFHLDRTYAFSKVYDVSVENDAAVENIDADSIYENMVALAVNAGGTQKLYIYNSQQGGWTQLTSPQIFQLYKTRTIPFTDVEGTPLIANYGQSVEPIDTDYAYTSKNIPTYTPDAAHKNLEALDDDLNLISDGKPFVFPFRIDNYDNPYITNNANVILRNITLQGEFTNPTLAPNGAEIHIYTAKKYCDGVFNSEWKLIKNGVYYNIAYANGTLVDRDDLKYLTIDNITYNDAPVLSKGDFILLHKEPDVHTTMAGGYSLIVKINAVLYDDNNKVQLYLAPIANSYVTNNLSSYNAIIFNQTEYLAGDALTDTDYTKAKYSSKYYNNIKSAGVPYYEGYTIDRSPNTAINKIFPYNETITDYALSTIKNTDTAISIPFEMKAKFGAWYFAKVCVLRKNTVSPIYTNPFKIIRADATSSIIGDFSLKYSTAYGMYGNYGYLTFEDQFGDITIANSEREGYSSINFDGTLTGQRPSRYTLKAVNFIDDYYFKTCEVTAGEAWVDVLSGRIKFNSLECPTGYGNDKIFITGYINNVVYGDLNSEQIMHDTGLSKQPLANVLYDLLGGTLTYKDLILSGSAQINDRVWMNSDIDALNFDTAGVVVKGGESIQKNLRVGKDIHIGGIGTNSTTVVDGALHFHSTNVGTVDDAMIVKRGVADVSISGSIPLKLGKGSLDIIQRGSDPINFYNDYVSSNAHGNSIDRKKIVSFEYIAGLEDYHVDGHNSILLYAPGDETKYSYITKLHGQDLLIIGQSTGNISLNAENGVLDFTAKTAILLSATATDGYIEFGSKIRANGGIVLDYGASPITITASNDIINYTDNSGKILQLNFNGFESGTKKIWHSGNMGSDSGLDADTVDTKHIGTSGNTIPLLDGANTWSGVQTFNAIPAFNGGTTGTSAPFSVDSREKVANLNADLFDGFESSEFKSLIQSYDHIIVTQADFDTYFNGKTLAAGSYFLKRGTVFQLTAVATLAQNVNIYSDGATVQRGNAFSYFVCNGYNTLTGWIFDGQGGVDATRGGSLTASYSFLIGIWNGTTYVGTTKVKSDILVTNCKVSSVGAGYTGISSNGISSVTYCELSNISYCTATNGGGVYSCDYSTISNVSYCTATNGGGVYDCDHSTIDNINNCTATNGGGVSNCTGSTLVGTFTGNKINNTTAGNYAHFYLPDANMFACVVFNSSNTYVRAYNGYNSGILI